MTDAAPLPITPTVERPQSPVLLLIALLGGAVVIGLAFALGGKRTADALHDDTPAPVDDQVSSAHDPDHGVAPRATINMEEFLRDEPEREPTRTEERFENGGFVPKSVVDALPEPAVQP